MHEFSGLTDGVMYIYVVVGYDSDGNYKGRRRKRLLGCLRGDEWQLSSLPD